MGNVTYISCITRMLLNSHSMRGMTKCPGSEKLIGSHCQFCEWYEGEEPTEEVENPVILEKEEAEWT